MTSIVWIRWTTVKVPNPAICRRRFDGGFFDVYSPSMAHPAPSPILVAVLVQALFSGLFYRSFFVCRKMVKYTVLQLTDG